MQDSGTDTDKETDQSGEKKQFQYPGEGNQKWKTVKLIIQKGGKAHKMEGDKA